jgi:hypothetical protein
MRPKERIDIFLKLFDIKRTITSFFPTWGIRKVAVVYTDIQMRFEEIKQYWLENPDLRFAQVLVNLNIVPNESGIWYYTEEYDILDNQEVPRREFLLWGQNYDKDMNRLPETKWAPIKDMSTEHIMAILDGGYANNSLIHQSEFNKELARREKE